MIFAQLIKSALIDPIVCESNLMFDDKQCLWSELMWAFASSAWGFVSTILSVSNVHMQIGHNRKDIRPKWYQDFVERFSISFRGFQVTQAQQHF